MSVPVGVGSSVHGRQESWHTLLPHTETGVIKRFQSKEALALILPVPTSSNWRWHDPLDLGQEIPASCCCVYLLLALLCDYRQFSDVWYFYFPNCNRDWGIACELVTSRTKRQFVKLPSRHSPALRKVKTRIFSSPWKKKDFQEQHRVIDTGKAGLYPSLYWLLGNYTPLERHNITHLW